MAGIKTFKKTAILIFVVIVVTAAVFTLCLFFTVSKFNEADNKKARQYFSAVNEAFSRGETPSVGGVDYAVLSLGGIVTYSTIESFAEGFGYDLKTLTGLDGTEKGGRVYFAAPYLKNNNQIGTLVLLIDKKLVAKDMLPNILWTISIGILCLGSAALLLFIYKRIRKDVFYPLTVLNKITKVMAGGDYSQKILYDFDDEMGELCHDLERLRDELSASLAREQQLRKNEKFLLACISHDLKTPLAVILGMAESLKDKMVAPKVAADKIIEKSSRLSKLIDDILEQTKASLGEFSINPKECYAKDFFEKEAAEFKAEAQKKSIGLILGSCPDCLVNIDRQRIYQVLQNLMGNALKYTKNGGRIEIGYEIQNRFLVISVSDSGVGIPSADYPFIFDKFYRGEKARTMDVAGSGLGLSIAKYIVEKHGGSIECDTLVGKGTKFSFSLPLNGFS